MALHPELDRITGSIRSASASIEARFLDIGRRLGGAIDTIGTLTQTFERLASELKGRNLHEAMDELSQIMSHVSALVHADNDGQAVFGKLAELTTTVGQSVVRMSKAVSDIRMLAMNARIEAANIGEAGIDFAIFSTEIGRTLRLAQDRLSQFTGELSGVGKHLRSAAASQLALAAHQAEAIRSVPVRLEESIGAIADRGRRAVAAAAAVALKSGQVGQRISAAIMALQIGDITRQRLEHVGDALSVMVEILGPTGEAKRAKRGDWSTLTDSQRHALVRSGAGLMSAQLLDAAAEFDREMRQILSSVEDLATDAEDILGLGSSAVGATDDHHMTFLGKVEGQVAEVDALLKGAATARHEADAVAASVSQATERLVAHASTLGSLEEDIRIMGLNMSLKCGRLGVTGRPLMVIAQELRIYSGHIAREADGIAVHLDGMVANASALSSGTPEESAARVETVAQFMADCVSRLRAAGESLAGALATLAHDTEDVASLLQDTVVRAAVHEEVSRTLRQAAADLASATKNSGREDDIATAEGDRMLDLIMGGYTMERERLVHDRQLNRRGGTTAPVVTVPDTRPGEPATLEDVLF